MPVLLLRMIEACGLTQTLPGWKIFNWRMKCRGRVGRRPVTMTAMLHQNVSWLCGCMMQHHTDRIAVALATPTAA
jgi:hypothetical protein